MNQKITTFYLAKMDRPALIGPHNFYVEETRKRVLTQFQNIEQESKLIEKQYIEESRFHFNPDTDDPCTVFEIAEQRGFSYWYAMKDLQKNMMLGLTAGMFHLFDKTLRQKMCQEFRHWQDENIYSPLIWGASFERVIALLEWIGIRITDNAFYQTLDACRLVVNVYKHGDGDSHRALSLKFPEYYPAGFKTPDFLSLPPANYDELEVSDTQFLEFAAAISSFWECIPEYTFSTQMTSIPEWLEPELKRVVKANTKKHLP